MSLFQNIDFTSHSGQSLTWRIECDALTSGDWEWAAARVAERVSFYNAIGIERGGKPFADALKPYRRTTGFPHCLLVDDVLTTGGSLIEEHRRLSAEEPDIELIGVVLFARIKPPEPWIKALFVMPEWG